MALQISDISAVLKKVIVPAIQNTLPKESVLFDKIKKNVGVTIANNNIYIAARVGRHSGIYTVAEGSNPDVGKSAYAQPYAAMKYAFGTLEISDQAIEAAKNKDLKAIASSLKSEIVAIKDDFRLDLNRQFHGAGTGKLCLTNGTGSSSTTLIVDGNPAGQNGTAYLAAGMYITLGSNGPTVAISSVDSATQVTLATATSWANDAVITKKNANECMGLAGLIDDGDNVATIQNIARASNDYAKSHVEDTAATLTEAQMINLYLATRQYGGCDVIFMGKTMYAKYGSLLTSMKGTANTREVLSGGWKGLDFMGGEVGVMLDFDCWDGYVQFVDFDSLTRAEMSEPFSWLEADAHGGILRRSPDNRTVWEGTLKYYLNLVALNFKTMGRLSNKQA